MYHISGIPIIFRTDNAEVLFSAFPFFQSNFDEASGNCLTAKVGLVILPIKRKHGDGDERKNLCCHFCHLSMRSNNLISNPLL